MGQRVEVRAHLHRGVPVSGAMQLCISYPDVIKNHSSCPAQLFLQPGLGWNWSLRSCPVCKEAGSSHCHLFPSVPLTEEKQDKGNF